MNSSGLYIGFAGYFSNRLCDAGSAAAEVASCLVSDRWPWAPSQTYFNFAASPARRTRVRKLIGERGAAALAEGIRDPQYYKATLVCTQAAVDHEVGAQVDTGGYALGSRGSIPFNVEGRTRGHQLPEGATIQAWIELVHELMLACDIACGVMPVWPTATKCSADVSLMRVVLDRPTGDVQLGPPGDFARDNERANHWRELLGDTNVRHPRWGTYLRRRHLDSVGGLEVVRERVAPAKIVELGADADLVFIQLTETPEGGLTAEAEHKRLELAEVMAPILPARSPVEDA